MTTSAPGPRFANRREAGLALAHALEVMMFDDPVARCQSCSRSRDNTTYFSGSVPAHIGELFRQAMPQLPEP